MRYSCSDLYFGGTFCGRSGCVDYVHWMLALLKTSAHLFHMLTVVVAVWHEACISQQL